MVGVLPSEPPSPLTHSHQMQCLHCHFEFRSAGPYGRHLRSQHPNEVVTSVFDEHRIDVQELLAEEGSKRGRALTRMIPEPSKRPRGNVQTPEIANATSEPSKRPGGNVQTPRIVNTTPGSSISQQNTRNECGGIPHNCPDLQESAQVVGKPGKGPLHLPPRYEFGKIVEVYVFKIVQSRQLNSLAPFENVYKYKLARFFHPSKTSLKNIDTFFVNNLLPVDLPGTASVYFKSGHTWQNKMRELIDQPPWHRGTVDFHLQHGCAFYYRDVECTLRYLLWPRTFAKHLVYEPVREFDGEGNTVYTEMHTGDWW